MEKSNLYISRIDPDQGCGDFMVLDTNEFRDRNDELNLIDKYFGKLNINYFRYSDVEKASDLEDIWHRKLDIDYFRYSDVEKASDKLLVQNMVLNLEDIWHKECVFKCMKVGVEIWGYDMVGMNKLNRIFEDDNKIIFELE